MLLHGNRGHSLGMKFAWNSGRFPVFELTSAGTWAALLPLSPEVTTARSSTGLQVCQTQGLGSRSLLHSQLPRPGSHWPEEKQTPPTAKGHHSSTSKLSDLLMLGFTLAWASSFLMLIVSSAAVSKKLSSSFKLFTRNELKP